MSQGVERTRSMLVKQAARAAVLVCAVTGCTKSTEGGGGGGPPGPAWPGTALSVSAGALVSCGLATDGTPWCWGYPLYWGLPVDLGVTGTEYQSQCGDGTSSVYEWPCIVASPVRLSTMQFTSIGVWGDASSPVCGLDAAGVAWCWDDRRYLELPAGAVQAPGQTEHWNCGGVSCRMAPRRVHSSAALRSYVNNGQHACAITVAGALLCMGANGKGQLGNPAYPAGSPDSLTPVASALTWTAFAVTLSGESVCAIATSGSAYCWGTNDFGQLGIGSQVPKTSPTAINGTLKFSSIVAGAVHVCGLTLTGQAYCWGRNPEGDLGIGTAGNMAFAATPVIGGHTFTALAAGLVHTCGIDTAGAAWCWGGDEYGQLGNDWTSTCGVAAHCSPTPVAVHGGLTFKQLSGGLFHTCGLTTANELYCWGSGGLGELGDGYATGRNLYVTHPVKVVAQ